MTFKLGPYRNFVEGYRKHPDQGIKACEKKLKKEPGNTLYLLAQSELLYRQKRYGEALNIITTLKFTPQDQLDEDLLLEIQHIVVQCQYATSAFNHTAGSQLLALWKQALDTASPNEAKYLRKAMFNAAWRDELWDLAVQLFARLQKEQPNNVRYHYAWIACAQLQASTMPKDDRTAQNLKLLAFRSLKAIVDNTIANKQTVRKLSDSNQWRILVQVYTAQAQYGELKQIFNNDKIASSKVHGGDIENVRMYLDTLQALNEDETVFNFAMDSFRAYRTAFAGSKVVQAPSDDDTRWADDWNLWKAMITSQEKNEKNRTNINAIPELAQSILDVNPLQRNASRARLTCLMKYQRASLLGALMQSFSANAMRRACFGDMKEFMKALTHDEEERFLNHIDSDAKAGAPWDETNSPEVADPNNTKNWVMININALKFEYLLCISKAPLPTKDSLEAFFSDSLRMYKIALGYDKECGDEACILAVMALVKLHHFSRDYDIDEKDPMNPSKDESSSEILPPQSYLIQAIVLLEFLRNNSPHNYYGALLLTLIAQMLNLTSLAGIALGSLNIKEVQHDTIGHLFWSRISISHPYPCSKKLSHQSRINPDYSSPSEGLSKALGWYEVASEKTNRFMSENLDNVPFDQLFQFDEFRSKIERSFCRAMYLLEERRMARLTEGLTAFRDMEALPPTFRRMTVDSRDFATVPSFEYQTTDTFDNFVVTKPKPSKYWLSRQSVNDTILTLLYSRPPHEPYLLPQLDADIIYLKENADDMRYQLTSSEQKVTACWDALVPLIRRLVFGPTDKEGASMDPAATLKKIQSWLQDTVSQYSKPSEESERNILPLNEALQGAYLSLEAIHAVSLFCDAVSSASGGKTAQYQHHTAGAKTIAADVVKETKQAAKEAYDAIHLRAESWRSRVKEQGGTYVDKALFSGVTGEDVRDLLSADDNGGWNKEAVVKDIVDSAIDSLDGLCMVKMV